MLNRIPKPTYLWQKARHYLRASPRAFSADEVAAVLTQYDLDWSPELSALAGGNSSNVLLETRQGRKVLKRYVWPWPHAQTEHALVGHLGQQKFPVPALQLNRHGQTHAMLAGRTYALYEFVEGFAIDNYLARPALYERWVAQAGEALGRLHQAVVGFTPSGEKPDGFMREGGRLVRDVNWHLATFNLQVEAAHRAPVRDALTDFVLKIAAPLRHALSEVSYLYDGRGLGLPRSAIHADFAPKNVLFNRQGVAAVLDFGDACVNLRGLDVARGLTTFAALVDGEVDARLSEIFLCAYTRRSPLLPEEVQALPDLARWRHLRNIVWGLERLRQQPGRHGRDELFAFIAGKWAENLWLERHAQALTRRWHMALDASLNLTLTPGVVR